MVGDAPPFLESIEKGIPGLPTIESKVGNPTKEVEIAPPIPLDIEVVEIALMIAPLALCMVVEEEVQLTDAGMLV